MGSERRQQQQHSWYGTRTCGSSQQPHLPGSHPPRQVQLYNTVDGLQPEKVVRAASKELPECQTAGACPRVWPLPPHELAASVSIAQFRWARNCRAAGNLRSRGTHTRSRRYASAGTTTLPSCCTAAPVSAGSAAGEACLAATPTKSACATCRRAAARWSTRHSEHAVRQPAPRPRRVPSHASASAAAAEAAALAAGASRSVAHARPALAAPSLILHSSPWRLSLPQLHVPNAAPVCATPTALLGTHPHPQPAGAPWQGWLSGRIAAPPPGGALACPPGRPAAQNASQPRGFAPAGRRPARHGQAAGSADAA